MNMSFRLRIFFTAAAIVATVLTAVMATGWSRVMDFEVGRLDQRLCSEARRMAMERFAPDELPRLAVDVQSKLALRDPSQLLLQFVDPNSGQRYQSTHWNDVVHIDSLRWSQDAELNLSPRGPVDGGARTPPRAGCSFASFESKDDQWRIARAELSGAMGTVAANLIAQETEIQNALIHALLIEIPISLLLTGLGAWMLSAFALRPVNRLRESMRTITPLGLDQRVAVHSEDQEFKELISAYNTMLERLERSFQQASRFSADAAHELKTPLTILRGRLEQARRRADSDDLRADLSELLDEVGRLSAITRKLLLLSQADAGKLELNLEPFNLTDEMNEVLSDAQLMTEDKVLTSSIAADLFVNGDAVLIRQLMNNLLSNSVRYSPPGGAIDITVRHLSGNIEVVFSNSCRSIQLGERSRFFERFFRGDAAHNRHVDGNGLGLSLALEIAKAHRGTLVLLPSAENVVCLQLLLPSV
jgi:heavy metal sensor kinase